MEHRRADHGRQAVRLAPIHQYDRMARSRVSASDLSGGPRCNAARQPRPRIHRRQFIDLDEHSRPQSSAHQRSHPPAARPRRAHFVPRFHQPGSDRACPCNCRSFPNKHAEQSFLLRRRFNWNRGRLTDRRSVLASAKFKKTPVHRFQERLSWRYGRRCKPGRGGNVPSRTVSLGLSGTLQAVREWCDRTDTLLIADEVMTGFGRTGRMFAIEHESVIPDIMVLGKGLSGGYLPLAITVVSEKLFSTFDGSIADGRALAYGHSYTGNALGCVAAKASLEIFEKEGVLEGLQPKIRHLTSELAGFADLPGVVEVRQCGFIAGIEVAELSEAPLADQAAEICIAARRHGLLTRPIRNVIVLMPPFCITTDQIAQAVEAIRTSIIEVCGHSSSKE